MTIAIPGYRTLNIDKLVLDYNGTIALDGTLEEGVKEKLNRLSAQFSIYILTADTHGTAKNQCSGVKAALHTFPAENAAESKRKIVEELGKDSCVTVGNGRNDILMSKIAALSIAIVGKEGAYGPLLGTVDLCLPSVEAALDLLLKPKRLIADLRG